MVEMFYTLLFCVLEFQKWHYSDFLAKSAAPALLPHYTDKKCFKHQDRPRTDKKVI